MKNIDIIRAWKDQAYRNGLTPEQRAALPANPAGASRLSTEAMRKVHGGIVAVGGVDFAAAPGTLFRSRQFTCSKYFCAIGMA